MPRTKEQLVGIKTIWKENMTPQLCQQYVSHLTKVIPAVVENEGGASGY